MHITRPLSSQCRKGSGRIASFPHFLKLAMLLRLQHDVICHLCLDAMKSINSRWRSYYYREQPNSQPLIIYSTFFLDLFFKSAQMIFIIFLASFSTSRISIWSRCDYILFLLHLPLTVSYPSLRSRYNYLSFLFLPCFYKAKYYTFPRPV